MNKAILFIAITLCWNISFAQDKEAADKVVDEGVNYHDKGDYEGAIAKYDKALSLDKDNLLALTEKAYTLLTQEKYDESIKLCQLAIEKHPGEKGLRTLYVTYGNALDGQKKTDKSLEIYEEGIKLFPDAYQLYFNKGITLFSVKKYDDAMLCFQKSVKLNPRHAGSHNALARLYNINDKHIPALLAYCRFMVLEPESKRAKENLEQIKKISKGDVEQTGKKAYTIHVSADAISDTTKDGKKKEDFFGPTDLILSLDAGLDNDKKNKKKTEVEQFIRKMETVCSSLSEQKKDDKGFCWNYYAPYFIQMKEDKFVETFGYVAFASSDDPEISKWIKAHKSDIDRFYEWSKSYAWPE